MARKRPTGAGAPPLKPGLAAMRALAHPLRLRVIELFAEAPRTTKQVAELLGQPPTRLYHHVAALERAGLLRLVETRKNRGTTEKWYEAASRTMGNATTLSERKAKTGTRKSQRHATRAMAMTVLEQSRQEIVAAMGRLAEEAPLLARLVIVAPPERIDAFRTRLYQMLKDVQREFHCDDGAPRAEEYDRWAMTLTFAPVSPRGS